MYWVDYGRALARLRGRHDDAVMALLRAEKISPRRVHRNPFAREVIAGLLARSPRDSRIGRELRRIVDRPIGWADPRRRPPTSSPPAGKPTDSTTGFSRSPSRWQASMRCARWPRDENASEQGYGRPSCDDYDHRSDGAESREYHKIKRDAAYYSLVDSVGWYSRRIFQCSSAAPPPVCVDRLRNVYLTHSYSDASFIPKMIRPASEYDPICTVSAGSAPYCSKTASNRHRQSEVQSWKGKNDRHVNESVGPVAMCNEVYWGGNNETPYNKIMLRASGHCYPRLVECSISDDLPTVYCRPV
jgi:hypothetical protein